MCGFVATVALRPDAPVDPDRLARMRDALAHRGPDGAGLWIEGRAGLAHRRLAIVDEAGGHQPMSNEDGSVMLVFNGEIYNHEGVRARLLDRGHCYRTRSDTETIVHAYDEYGDACPEYLEGMFAFALWDRRHQRLLVARDRLGIKPVYFVEGDDELLCASEAKALLAGGVRASLDPAVLGGYLATRHAAAPATFFRAIRKLPPGHLLTWSAREGIAIRAYWQLPDVGDGPPPTFAGAVRAVRTELEASVERHLMSDRPVGVLLSGGLDSSALAAIAARRQSQPLHTFSVGFHEAEGDELPYARQVAEAIGSVHHEVRVTPGEFFEALPRLVAQQDEPMAFASGVPLYFVSRLAQAHVKVVLTGEGADELFLGYNRYRVTFWNGRIGRPYWSMVPRAVQRRVRAWVARLPHQVRRRLERSCLSVQPGARSLFFDNFSVFSDTRLADLLVPDHLSPSDPHEYGLRCYDTAVGGPLERMAAADLRTYLCELLTKQDRMSMAASIESRVPFLDDRLVDLVCALPGSYKLRGWTTKAVLRAAVADLLPPAILTRRKMGFPVPLARWFRQSYRHVVEEFVLGARARARGVFSGDALERLAAEHDSGLYDHSERLWLLVNLELWLRIFVDGEPAADITRRVVRGEGGTRAHRLDQDGRAVAARYGRSPAHVPDAAGPVAPA